MCILKTQDQGVESMVYKDVKDSERMAGEGPGASILEEASGPQQGE